jgi:hypothetical protein
MFTYARMSTHGVVSFLTLLRLVHCISITFTLELLHEISGPLGNA